MDSACVHEVQIAIHELTQGIQMAQQLRLHLHSPEARDFFIKDILSSCEKALLVLRSGASAGQPWAPALPAPALPESSMFITSPPSEEFEFDQPLTIQQEQNIICKKRKVPTTWEDQVRLCSDNGLEGNTDDSYNWRKYGQKDVLGANFPGSYNRSSYPNKVYKAKLTCDDGAQSASPSPPPPPPPISPLPEKHEIAPYQHHQQLSPLNQGIRANLSVNTSDLGCETMASSFSSPSTSFGLGEDFHQLQFPTQYYDELLLVYSPRFNSLEWRSAPSQLPPDPTL